jgi:hypothetical protein
MRMHWVGTRGRRTERRGERGDASFLVEGLFSVVLRPREEPSVVRRDGKRGAARRVLPEVVYPTRDSGGFVAIT